jgi:hypothetical protein
MLLERDSEDGRFQSDLKTTLRTRKPGIQDNLMQTETSDSKEYFGNEYGSDFYLMVIDWKVIH